MSSPFKIKSASEIKDELIEHLVNGTPTIHDESHLNSVSNPTYVDDIPPYTYKLQCGLPDVTDGQLITIERVWGKKNSNFFEFTIVNDFSINTDTNQLIFIAGNEPDLETDFYVDYKYDQKYKSELTNAGRGSVVDLLFSPIANRIAEVMNSLQLVKNAAFIDTALGSDLDELVKLVNLTRKQASKANGYVTVYRDSSSGKTIIPAGLQFSTNATQLKKAILFENTMAGLFFDGFTSARLPVVAKTGYEGTQGNIAPLKLTNVDISLANITSVVNPSNYQDYELQDLILGKYVYNLSKIPERVINSGNVYPPSSADKGLFVVMNWFDDNIKTSLDWTAVDPNTELTITEDEPEAGTIKVEVSGVTGTPYLEIATVSIPRQDNTWDLQGYDQIFCYARGQIGGEQFKLQVVDASANVGDPLLYKFGDVFPQSAVNIQTLGSTFDLFHGLHDLAGVNPETSNITKVRIYFTGTGTFYFKWIGMGTFLLEKSTFTDVDQVKISYTSGKVTLNSTTGQDFFVPYDGDGSDSHVDQLFVYYKWKNNFGGGSETETDDDLRERAKTSVSGLGKGTKASIKKALLDIDSVKQAEVLDYDDDQSILPGDIDVILFAESFSVSSALQQQIIDAINANKAAGVRANIFLPELRYINFNINFVFDDRDERYSSTTGQSALITLINSAITDYFGSYIDVNRNLYWPNLIGYVIQQIDVVISGTVTEDGSTTPTYVDDDIGGVYTYNSSVIKSGYIVGIKSGVSIVIQQGNSVNVTLTRLTSQ